MFKNLIWLELRCVFEHVCKICLFEEFVLNKNQVVKDRIYNQNRD